MSLGIRNAGFDDTLSNFINITFNVEQNHLYEHDSTDFYYALDGNPRSAGVAKQTFSDNPNFVMDEFGIKGSNVKAVIANTFLSTTERTAVNDWLDS